MLRNRPVSLALVGLFVGVTACTSYTPIDIAEWLDHGKVRVTSVSTGSTEIRDPFVEADSLRGTVGDYDYAIPLAGVSVVEAVGTDVGGTIALSVLGAALVAAIVGMATYDMCILSC